LEELTIGDHEAWFLKNLALSTGCPEGLFYSIRQLAELEPVIASQAALLRERDGAIEAQGQLLVERWNAIEEMNGMIVDRDRCIAAQDAMIQERWHAMQEMSRIIDERQEEIRDLRSDRLVKLALRLRKAMRWLRLDSDL
jgi:uncharacterized protein (DUF3084 family)